MAWRFLLNVSVLTGRAQGLEGGLEACDTYFFRARENPGRGRREGGGHLGVPMECGSACGST